RVVFETIGDKKVYRRFKDLNSVIVTHPMKWVAYRSFLLSKRRHIGLVPFSNSGFNLAKGYTKFFEIVACGAVGIYSQDSPYARIIKSEEDGILLPKDRHKWVEAIKSLLEDEDLRHRLFLNSINKLYLIRKSVEKTYEDVIKRRLD
ncbi:MAG: glycosyltransferase, partial [Aquificaceae bacterium]